jgi:hypothetical protein
MSPDNDHTEPDRKELLMTALEAATQAVPYRPRGLTLDLIQHRVRPAHSPLQIAQGRFTGRPSIIEVRREPRDGHFWVGGPVAPVAAGHFHAHISPPDHSVNGTNRGHSS